METTSWASTVWEDGGEIQPEGGLSLDDISCDAEFDEGTLDVFDEDPVEQPNEDDATGHRTTEPEAEDDAGAGEEKEEPEIPTRESGDAVEPSEPRKLKFRAQIDHKGKDVEISETDLPELYQKSSNFDRLQKRFDEKDAQLQRYASLAAQLGFDSTDEMFAHATKQARDERVAALVNGGTAQDIAEDYVDRAIERERAEREAKRNPSGKDAQSGDDAQSDGEKREEEKPAIDYAAQVTELFRVRPELKGTLKKLPDEVTREVVENGVPLRTAYAEWEARQIKAENDRMRKEKERFAQQAETAARAPVRGAREGTQSKEQKQDPFIFGFDSDRSY